MSRCLTFKLFLSRKEKLSATFLLDHGLWIPLQGKIPLWARFKLFLIFKQLSFTLVSAQVDEQSVFRHRGERKVKTVEEDMEDVASKTAELLEEGEELIGSRHEMPHCIYWVCVTTVRCHNRLCRLLQVMTAVMKIRVREEMERRKGRLKMKLRGMMVRVENWTLFLRRTTWRRRRGKMKKMERKRRWRMKKVKSSAFQTQPSPSLIYSPAGNATTAAPSNKHCHCVRRWTALHEIVSPYF